MPTVPCWALQMSPISPHWAASQYQPTGKSMGPLPAAMRMPMSGSVAASIISCEWTDVAFWSGVAAVPQPVAQSPVATSG